MTKKALFMMAGLALGTSANAALVSLSASGLYDASGNAPALSSKTIAIIDVDGDGLAGFDLANWDGSSFLPDSDDVIITGDGVGVWNENTGDGDGFEALVPANIAASVLDGSGTGYSFASADAAGNTPSVIGEGDMVYLFYFPNLPGSAQAPGAGQSFGVIEMGALPGPSGSLTTSLISPSSSFLANNVTVPEPTTLALIGLGGLVMMRRRK